MKYIQLLKKPRVIALVITALVVFIGGIVLLRVLNFDNRQTRAALSGCPQVEASIQPFKLSDQDKKRAQMSVSTIKATSTQFASMYGTRKEALIRLMSDDPTEAYKNIMSGQYYKSKDTSGCLEQPISLEGYLTAINYENLKTKQEKIGFTLLNIADKKTYTVYPANVNPNELVKLDTTKTYKISGYGFDKLVVFDGKTLVTLVPTPTYLPPSQTSVTPANTTTLGSARNTGIMKPQIIKSAALNPSGTNKALVLLVTLSGSAQAAITRDQVNTKLFTQDPAIKSLYSYFKGITYGKMSMTGDTRDYFSIAVPTPLTCSGNEITTITNTITQYATSTLHIDWQQYSNLLIYTNVDNCLLGMATLTPNYLYTPGYPYANAQGYYPLPTAWFGYASLLSDDIGVPTHEVGHNLGVHHASDLRCGPNAINSPSCNTIEYGDKYDQMGMGSPTGGTSRGQGGPFDAPHREIANIFDTTNKIETIVHARLVAPTPPPGGYGSRVIAQTPDQYLKTILPIDSNVAGTKALKIYRSKLLVQGFDPIPTNPNSYLYVEFRQPIGLNYASWAADGIYNGVLLHTVPADNIHTYFVHPYPSTTYLGVNQFFIDPLSGTRITLKSIDNSNPDANLHTATLLIDYAPTYPMTGAFQTLTVTPTSIQSTGSVSINYTLTTTAPTATKVTCDVFKMVGGSLTYSSSMSSNYSVSGTTSSGSIPYAYSTNDYSEDNKLYFGCQAYRKPTLGELLTDVPLVSADYQNLYQSAGTVTVAQPYASYSNIVFNPVTIAANGTETTTFTINSTVPYFTKVDCDKFKNVSGTLVQTGTVFGSYPPTRTTANNVTLSYQLTANDFGTDKKMTFKCQGWRKPEGTETSDTHLMDSSGVNLYQQLGIVNLQ